MSVGTKKYLYRPGDLQEETYPVPTAWSEVMKLFVAELGTGYELERHKRVVGDLPLLCMWHTLRILSGPRVPSRLRLQPFPPSRVGLQLRVSLLTRLVTWTPFSMGLCVQLSAAITTERRAQGGCKHPVEEAIAFVHGSSNASNGGASPRYKCDDKTTPHYFDFELSDRNMRILCVKFAAVGRATASFLAENDHIPSSARRLPVPSFSAPQSKPLCISAPALPLHVVPLADHFLANIMGCSSADACHPPAAYAISSTLVFHFRMESLLSRSRLAQLHDAAAMRLLHPRNT
ncbi:hypothetical protein C8R43DRAFT_1119329 [Mycena crocata]|nr:hypothetical protein C8R43DRAFT_1119329 [Mycena crocata]